MTSLYQYRWSLFLLLSSFFFDSCSPNHTYPNFILYAVISVNPLILGQEQNMAVLAVQFILLNVIYLSDDPQYTGFY